MMTAQALWPAVRESGFALAFPDACGLWPSSPPLAGTRHWGNHSPAPLNRGSRFSASFADVIYNQLHLFPPAIDMGLRTSEIVYSGVCWNAFMAPQTLTVSRDGYSGILDTLEDGTTVQPCAETAFTLTITMSGDPIIDARLGVACPASSVVMSIAGRRGVAWAFMPNSGLVERWEYRTSTLTLWDYSEERLPLRVTPRISVDATYTLDPCESGYLETLVYDMGQSRFCLPHFERQTEGFIRGGVTDTIVCDTGPGQWLPGDMGLVWQDALTSEIIVVASVDMDGLALDSALTTRFDGPVLVLPCANAQIAGDVQRTDHGYAVSDWSLSFQLSAVPRDAVPETVEQFEGDDVWETPLALDGDSCGRVLSLPHITLDNGLGPAKRTHAAPSATQSQTVRLCLEGKAEIATARGLLLRRQGRCRPFWASTRRQDFELAAAYSGNGSTALHVRHWASDYLGKKEGSLRRIVRIELEDGTVFLRRILGVSRLNATTDVIALSSTLTSEAVPLEAFVRISFLSRFRLASDVIEWRWDTPDRAAVSFQIEETL